jgi:hypothetical protein
MKSKTTYGDECITASDLFVVQTAYKKQSTYGYIYIYILLCLVCTLHSELC